MYLSPRILALAVIALAGLALGQEELCPPDYEEVAGECYRFLPLLRTTWPEARLVCQDDGADLAIFRDCEAFSAVVRHINSNGLAPEKSFWIGADDNGDLGDWSWIDDSPMDLGVPFWGRGELLENEPNGGEDQNCAALDIDDRFYFHDKSCEDELSAVCELQFHPEDTPCPEGYFPIDASCFLIDLTVVGTWADQRAYCQSLGSDLAILDDCGIYQDFVNFIDINGLNAGSLWIGGTDLGNEGSWSWVNGEAVPLGVPFWGRTGEGANQPGNDDGEQQNCASLWKDDRFTIHDDGCGEFEGRSPLCHFGGFEQP